MHATILNSTRKLFLLCKVCVANEYISKIQSTLALYYTSLVCREFVCADALKSSDAHKETTSGNEVTCANGGCKTGWLAVHLLYSCLSSPCHGITFRDCSRQGCNNMKGFSVKKIWHDPYMHYQPVGRK